MSNQTEKEQLEQEIIEETVEQAVEMPKKFATEQNTASEPDLLNAANARIAELELYVSEVDKREQDIALRARAEIENVRRRAEQDVEKAHKFALEKFSKELLNVVDNLERGLQALEGAEESVKSGVELTHKGLVSTLNQFGVEAVGAVGEVFNPELHQAISMQPAEGIEPNHISVVLQKGYTLHGRVIRPAMVMVAA